MSAKSRHRVLAGPRSTAVTIFSAQIMVSGYPVSVTSRPSKPGRVISCGAGHIGSPTFTSTCKLIRALANEHVRLTRIP